MATKLEQLKEWAKQNVTMIDLLPNNSNLQVTTRLIDVLEDEVDEKYYLSDEKVSKLTLNHDLNENVKSNITIEQVGNIVDNKETFGGNPQRGRVYNSEGLSPALNCMRGGGLEPKVAVREVNQGVVMGDKGIRFTEDGFHTHRNDNKKSSIQGTHVTYKEGKTHALTSNHVPMTLNNSRIRKLTPLECWRLQGFTDEQFYKAKNSGVSNSQLYKQSGNAITISVADAIIKKITEG